MSRTSTLIRRLVGRPVETAGDGPLSDRDGSGPAGTGGGISGMNGSRFPAIPMIAAITVAVVLVNAFSSAHDGARLGGPYDLGPPLFFEATSGLVMIALLPLVRRAVAWLAGPRQWWQRIVGAVGLAIAFSGLHILGMVALRITGAALAGGGYQFDWAHDVPYEFRKDLVSLMLIAGCFWLADRRTRPVPVPAATPAPPPGPSEAAASVPPDTLWLKDGATTIRIEPRAVLTVTSAGNYVEFDVGDRRHLVRGTLISEETRLAPFGIVRVHRTRLVNLGRVVQLSPTPQGDFTLQLDSGATVTGSRRYREAVASALGRV